ncbi:carbohydrate kinase family protein [Candidatus Cryosericum septentrionale]|jgi:fructokinase|uniref:Carbohydrate kinase n=1 Tax=Candidatus Cryosericum septentrionale TaxID=2290913 RepID=A0A398DIB4_9BACT|nr:carbohydrate kinase [Candidatus Cryosericum septentrionale]RIE15386.1 carbohydrate kinase [Candidatus Cryosericum septentrionale]
MFDVTALGELLIDFTPCGISPAGMRLFEQNPGGAPANVLCALSNLGLKTAFIGKVGQDMHGDFLYETLQSQKVCTTGLVQDSNVFTTLAFVELSESGERSFSFARKPGADTCLRIGELNEDIIKNTKVFHFGSLSLTDEPARSTTFSAVETAKSSGAIISYDPNYRALLWKSREEAMVRMRSVLSLVDIIKMSDEETELLTGAKSPDDASKILIESGIPCAVITLGKDGALIRTKTSLAQVKAIDCTVVDTTGAGDAFWGGFLYKLVQSNKRPGELTAEEANDFVEFANAVATLCVQKRGAIPAMPYLKDVMNLYQQKVRR